MKLSELADYLEQVAETNSRIEKQDLVWEALNEAEHEQEKDVILSLTTCQRFEDNGVAKKTVRKVAGEVVDGGVDVIRDLESEKGDLPSAVGKACKHTGKLVPRKEYDLRDLLADLEEIEEETGGNMLHIYIRNMLSNYKHPKWVAHAVLADDGVSMGFGVKSAAKMIRRNYDSISKEDMATARAVTPDILELNKQAPDVPLEPQFGTAFKPMLASSKDMPKDPDGEWLIQPKYDGARVLVHYDKGNIKAFSRRCNEVTESLPELQELSQILPDGGRFILDGEAVAYKDDEPQDFQYIMTRFNREENIEEQDIDVRFHFFDAVHVDHPEYEMFLNGHIADENNYFRSKSIVNLFAQVAIDNEGISHEESLEYAAPYDRVYSKDSMVTMYESYVDLGYEGAIIKRCDAPYDYDKRSHDWRKVKKDTENVDLRVSEIIEGEDDRAGRMGAIRLETEDGYDLTKCGTGFTEEDQEYFWENRAELLGAVVEVDWFELQESAGEYSLRFPVFKSIRDKDEADSLERVKKIA